MDELKEFLIYRGYKAELPVSIEDPLVDIGNIGAVVYSPLTNERFYASSSVENDEILFTWSAAVTATMKAGTYNIEFYNNDELYVVRSGFVKVQKAAPADGKTVPAN